MKADPDVQPAETAALSAASTAAAAPSAPAPAPAAEPQPPQAPQPLSKNAQKKAARAARIAEQKKERRAYEKEKKKEKRRELAAKRAAGELDDDEQPRKKARIEGPRTPFEARIVVDLGFDNLMTENEVKSLTNQLGYTYNANKKSSQPFASLLYTGLGGRTFTRLESMSDAGYKRWKETEWWHEGYERLWEGKKEDEVKRETDLLSTGLPADQSIGEGQKVDAKEEEGSILKLRKNPQTAPRESVVYLTADSTDELSELKEGETYIIGGIVDHNRYKNLCLNKAQTSQIRTARLPIGTYLAELKTRKVLTVNQTFDILLKWVETRDWKAAFEEVIPKRKFNEKSKASRRGGCPSEQPGIEDGNDHAEVDGEERQVIVDAAVLEEDDEGDDEDAEGDIEVAGSGIGSVVATTPDTEMTNWNGLAIAMDDAHPEVPQQAEPPLL
ncbi:tRNA methyltransferase Trm10-like protein [Phanerochaete sordida]|uniref:tRNA (guanine(9)-N1)-methyltransferase n=1 Tax=Phanerochaete sordida TaxID=48140 RepID=A0A9P3G4M2_9APHY|nr:tRNA methyltransferase Trm10-like protein [Phanerochaete sordida]